MKPTPFEGNGRGLYVEHHRVREGDDYFVISYKNSSRIVSSKDPKDVWRVLGTAKHTETGKALKEWAVEITEKYLPKPEPRQDTSFASEALQEDQEDPTANTKMIT